MYTLFSEPRKTTSRAIIPTDFIDPAKRLRANVDKVVQFYRLATSFTDTLHVLTRLVTVIAAPIRYEPARYYSLVHARWHGEASNLGMTTSYNTGRWHRGEFYHDCDEIIFAHATTLPVFEMEKNWRNLQPVKVLEHPVSNLGLTLPDGKRRNSETGMVFIAVDVPMLMMQWYFFMQDQLAIRTLQEQGFEQERPLLGPKDFVGKYVIPNMLYSQTELVLFNRIYNLYYDRPMGEALTTHRFTLLSPGGGLDRALVQVVDRISERKMLYSDMLEQMPRLYEDFPYGMPDMAETRQVWWALFLARLRMIEFLLDVGNEQALQMNRTDVNRLVIDLRRLKSDNAYKRRLLSTQRDDVERRLTELLNRTR